MAVGGLLQSLGGVVEVACRKNWRKLGWAELSHSSEVGCTDPTGLITPLLWLDVDVDVDVGGARKSKWSVFMVAWLGGLRVRASVI